MLSANSASRHVIVMGALERDWQLGAAGRVSKPLPSLSMGRDEASGSENRAEDEQTNQVRVLAHRYLRRSIVTPATKNNKAVPSTAAVHSRLAPSLRKSLSSMPKTATSTPISRIASPIISATPCRSVTTSARNTSTSPVVGLAPTGRTKG